MAVDLLENLNLRNGRRKSMLELEDALAAPPEIVARIDGAVTLTLVVADAERRLLRSVLIREKSWSQVAGVRFELARVAKAGDRITLTYEDGIAAALRRRDDKLVIPAGKMTRRDIVARLAREARVPYAVDPQEKRKVATAVKRSVGKGERTNSWELAGTLAEERRWRRFSDGHRFYVGSDEWLRERRDPVRLREHTGAVQGIDFNGDTRRRSNTATVAMDAGVWALRPGWPVRLGDEMGPAAGIWLVEEVRRDLVSTRATVQLTRTRQEIPEPKRQPKGDRGEPDYLPGVDSGSAGGGTAASAARERMVQVALAQNGKPYVWGGHGPDVFDCSGLVQYATAAAGKVCYAPSASQAARVAAAGGGMAIDAAIRTRGALLFRMGSPYNHVAISLGNGSTIEAMGSAYGVCIGSAAGRGWTSAGIWI